MRFTTFDVETDGLYKEATKIHCLSYEIYENSTLIESGSLTNYLDIYRFVSSQETLVGHNIIVYDIPVLEKILGQKIPSHIRLIDTLALSWYLFPTRAKHGLEIWGEEFGVPKPVIEDWSNLTIEEYIHRCEEDVKITSKLFIKELEYLSNLYEGQTEKINFLIDYLSFKMDCIREQQEEECTVDLEALNSFVCHLEDMKAEKFNALQEAMPLNIKYKTISKPSNLFKKDGNLSVRGIKWLNILEEYNLPLDYEEDVRVIKSSEQGNPDSPAQVKDWLFSLGWQPAVFEERINTAGEVKQVPQVYIGGKVCDSIKDLYEIEPAFENLDMLSLVKHRLGVFKSFKENLDLEKKTVIAGVRGLTNTLRFRHRKPIANLPSSRKFYGKEIRSIITIPSDEYRICGSDMSSLEDSTKQHYMYFYDPEYVKQMRVPGFDPHLDIAVLSGLMSSEEAQLLKDLKDKTSLAQKGEGLDLTEQEYAEMHRLSELRSTAKVINFAGIYGAGPPKIAKTTGMPLSKAFTLHKTYWTRNKAVKQISNACKVKTIGDQMWLYNPVSKLWYSLRYEKDKFSTLNQGTGVFMFDNWVSFVRKKGIKIMLQYHDEILFKFERGKEEQIETALYGSISEVNNKIKLNIPLNISVDFGENYYEVH